MRPWLLILWLLGLAAAAAASWFLAKQPLVADPDLGLLLSLLPVVVWALLPVVFSRLFFRRSTPETPALRDLRRQVGAFLADRGLKGRRGRYSVPFFLIVGPAGSGKTCLLESAEMRLGMPKTIGPANWWVGPDAVFVEAQVSDDAGELFRLLRAVRPKLPVNGIMLVVSPADLVLADQLEQRMTAETIAAWFRQADEMLDQTLPAYVLLSRTDLVPGFQEIFERIEPADRAQPWGFALPHDAREPKTVDALHAEIDAGFGDMVETMRKRHIELLSKESEPIRSSHIHGFSAQIAAIQRIVMPLIDAMTPLGNGTWRGVLLRGIFMTSARQEMLSIDALLPELSRRFAMPRSGMLPPDLGVDDELNHGYFISGAVKKAILPEAGLVLKDRQGASRSVLYWLPIAATVIACAAGGYVLFSTFDNEIRLRRQVQEAIGDAAPLKGPLRRADVPVLLAALQRLDAVGVMLDGQRPVPAYAFWLDKRAMLSDGIADAKRAVRANALLPEIAAWLQADLVDDNNDTAALKDLIALADNPASPQLKTWLEKRAPTIAGDRDGEFVARALEAIDEAGGFAIDRAYVDAARRRIAYRESLT
ncbi:type VI protein secretion system component VasK [Shinella sp. BE166]|uniref:type VI secretion protein IcmF/TssM N-terminal domain-containing protein n=1 Tax=Shinella sp. BE166 TaxID=3373918 RepID=UPI003EC005A6